MFTSLGFHSGFSDLLDGKDSLACCQRCQRCWPWNRSETLCHYVHFAWKVCGQVCCWGEATALSTIRLGKRDVVLDSAVDRIEKPSIVRLGRWTSPFPNLLVLENNGIKYKTITNKKKCRVDIPKSDMHERKTLDCSRWFIWHVFNTLVDQMICTWVRMSWPLEP